MKFNFVNCNKKGRVRVQNSSPLPWLLFKKLHKTFVNKIMKAIKRWSLSYNKNFFDKLCGRCLKFQQFRKLELRLFTTNMAKKYTFVMVAWTDVQYSGYWLICHKLTKFDLSRLFKQWLMQTTKLGYIPILGSFP